MNNLTSGQTYYAIKVDDNNFKLASSASNASGGTALTIGGTGGSTTDKFTPPFSLEVLKMISQVFQPQFQLILMVIVIKQQSLAVSYKLNLRLP